MLLSPANQLDRVEALGSSTIGSCLSVNAAGVREEVTVDPHGRLDGTGVIYLSHDVTLAIQSVCWTHGVEAVAIHVRRGPAAVGLKRTAVVTNLASVALLGVGVAAVIDHALLVQEAPGGVQVTAITALLATSARQDVLGGEADGLLALALDGEAIAGH